MDPTSLIVAASKLASPGTFALLVFLATFFILRALMPNQNQKAVQDRVRGYLDQPMLDEERTGSFVQRIVLPFARRMLRILGKLAPKRAMSATGEMLIQAGTPWGLGTLDFYGLRVMVGLAAGAASFWFLMQSRPIPVSLLYAVAIGVAGTIMPTMIVRSRIDKRKKEIARALPNALDMLTIGVQAGLGFDAAMVRVSEQWHNALTQELKFAIIEMRIGTPRDVALRNLAERTGVADLKTLVAVLIQSSQLGVSIADVLHSQAAEMRKKRRQRAQGQARQASTKMAIPLVLLVFPAMFVVILGPAVPQILRLFA
jgi:tight adherence protein C